MDFYERVKTLAKTKTGKNLRDFIESLGMNYATYNGLKRHDNLPRADEAVKIAEALGTSVEFLVKGVDANPNSILVSLKEIEDRIQSLKATIGS